MGRYSHFFRTIFFVPLLWLAACASSPPISPTMNDIAPVPPKKFQTEISIQGRISVRYQRNGNNDGLHGSFTWQQTADKTHIVLFSPLGQTVATIDVTPAAATMTQAGSPPRSAVDADALVMDVLGWPLPIAGLRNWLQGFALDATGKQFVASPQKDKVTTIDGWHIHYVNWHDDIGQTPKRIDFLANTADAGEVAMRIVLDAELKK